MPLARVMAAGSAAGWVAAAAILVWTSTSGHVLAAGRATAFAAAIALPVIDVGTLLVRRRRRSLPYDKPSRATRRAMRQARLGIGRTVPGVRASRWRHLHFLVAPTALAALPRAARGPLVAGFWATVLAWAWQFIANVQGVGSGDFSVHGQQLAAAAWMMHCIAWCWFSCARLGRRRADGNGWL
jgi:hypothetical protein